MYRLCVNVILCWVLVLLAGQQICSGAFGKGDKPTIDDSTYSQSQITEKSMSLLRLQMIAKWEADICPDLEALSVS